MSGPTLGVRFGMTGGLVVDGDEALDRLLYGPGVFDDKWVRARVTFADGGHLLLHDPRRFGSLELMPNEARLGTRCALGDAGRARVRRWPSIRPGRAERPPSRRA